MSLSEGLIGESADYEVGIVEVVYFYSDTHAYRDAIYPGVGPAFARPLGWRTEPLSAIREASHDVAVIDPRLEQGDVVELEKYLGASAQRRAPLFFRVSDPDMPVSNKKFVKFIFEQKDRGGVHYASTYDPEGPLLEFFRPLKTSVVAHLPYTYDIAREIEVDLAARKRRLFLSGANGRVLYPLRSGLRKHRRWNPLLRRYVFDLRHPGYPDSGTDVRHQIVRDRYVSFAAQFTHFFQCGSKYNVELMKFLECAYAGSVPIGVPANSIRGVVNTFFRPYKGRTLDILSDLQAPIDELQERAEGYRNAMRQLRDPSRNRREFETQVRTLLRM